MQCEPLPRREFLRRTALAAAALPAADRPAWHPVVDSYSQLRKLFADPPAAYSTAPFLVWNGDAICSEAALAERWALPWPGRASGW